jgi:hypothetical protein
MGRSRPLNPALIFATVGAGICLGVGAVLPLWPVPNVPPAGSGCPFADPDSYSACPGTLWQAVLAAPALIRCPVWRTNNALVGASLLALGALAGADFYWFIVLPVASRLRGRKAEYLSETPMRVPATPPMAAVNGAKHKAPQTHTDH